MPKIKTQKTAGEKMVDAISGKALCECGGLVGLAAPMKCCKATVYRKMAAPSVLTIEDLKAIRKACGFSKDEMMALIAPMI